jgi:hypothetical protein
VFNLKKKYQFIDDVIGLGLKARQTICLGQWLAEQDHQASNQQERKEEKRVLSSNGKRKKKWKNIYYPTSL